MRLFDILKVWHHKRRKHYGHGITLLVPFRSDGTERQEIWDWLRAYWRHELPGAQLVVGKDKGHPFSKTCAINNAARRARGDVYVLLDADCYIPGEVIVNCAKKIRRAREHHEHLWFIPYRRLFRLTKEATQRLMASDPNDPLRFPTPPDLGDVEGTQGSAHGHWFGALIQIMPREAFKAVGGMDPRFRGWGGEDISFARAVDTIYGKHKTTRNQVLTLMHEKRGDDLLRMWEGQDQTGANNRISVRYRQAVGDRQKMLALASETRGQRPLSKFLSTPQRFKKNI